MNHKTQTAALALAVCAAISGCGIPVGGTPAATPAISAPVIVFHPEEQIIPATDLWRDDRSYIDTPLLDVPLAAETQRAIFEQCGQDTRLFCAVMAIASVESGFDTQTVGDGGDSLGMMQINTRWHTDRMETLGVTDLTDPVQCAAVAIDTCWSWRVLQEPERRSISYTYPITQGLPPGQDLQIIAKLPWKLIGPT